MTELCSRCGVDVPPILGPPPLNRDRWFRYAAGMRIRQVTYRLVFRNFTLQWLPENPADVVRETYTDLRLCNTCSIDVLMFAQGLEVARR